MYKINISNYLYAPHNNSALAGAYNVDIKKYPEDDGENEVVIMYGDFCKTLDCAIKLTSHTDKVAKIMKKNLMAPDKSSVLVLNVVDNVIYSKDEKELINILNSIVNREYLEAIMPCEVDYVAILTSSERISGLLEDNFKYDTTSHNTEIGYREVDIFVAKVE